MRWNRKPVALASPDMQEIFLPRSFMRRRAEELSGPNVSAAMGSLLLLLLLYVLGDITFLCSVCECISREYVNITCYKLLWRISPNYNFVALVDRVQLCCTFGQRCTNWILVKRSKVEVLTGQNMVRNPLLGPFCDKRTSIDDGLNWVGCVIDGCAILCRVRSKVKVHDLDQIFTRLPILLESDCCIVSSRLI